MRTMHLFAGIGGGLLADLILGHTPVVAVEWEPYACQVLRQRAADGWLPKEKAEALAAAEMQTWIKARKE